MKNILMITSLIFGVVAVANADIILNETASGVYTDTFPNDSSYGWYTNSGIYLGTFVGNDTSNFLDEIKGNLLTVGITTELTQSTVSYTTTNEDNGEILGTFTGPDDEDVSDALQSRTGTWTALPAPTTTITFYSVKAGHYYSLYQLIPAQGIGSWSTYDIWKYGEDHNLSGLGGNGGLTVSHFSGFNPNTTPVPEPVSILLFGTGIVGLVGVARRKKK